MLLYSLHYLQLNHQYPSRYCHRYTGIVLHLGVCKATAGICKATALQPKSPLERSALLRAQRLSKLVAGPGGMQEHCR